MPSDSTVFVDTSVLLCADDLADADKHARARAWLAALWMRRCGRLSTQVLSEYYASATRRMRPPMQSIKVFTASTAICTTPSEAPPGAENSTT